MLRQLADERARWDRQGAWCDANFEDPRREERSRAHTAAILPWAEQVEALQPTTAERAQLYGTDVFRLQDWRSAAGLAAREPNS